MASAGAGEEESEAEEEEAEEEAEEPRGEVRGRPVMEVESRLESGHLGPE